MSATVLSTWSFVKVSRVSILWSQRSPETVVFGGWAICLMVHCFSTAWTLSRSKRTGLAVHGAGLAVSHTELSDPLMEQCNMTRYNATFSGQSIFSILWCWPSRWPINSCLFYALSSLCSLNKTLKQLGNKNGCDLYYFSKERWS